MSRHAPVRSVVASFAAAMVVMVSTPFAMAGSGDPQIHRTSAGNEAAQRATAKLSDIAKVGFGKPHEWSGGPTAPDFPPAAACTDFHPDLSSVVVNGAAKAVFKHSWHRIFNQATVFSTAKQMELDWRLSAQSPAAFKCLRKTLAKPGDPSTRFQSLRRLPTPNIGTHATAYRAVFVFGTPNAPERAIMDMLFVTQDATAIAIVTQSTLASAPAIWRAELRLARLLVTRARG